MACSARSTSVAMRAFILGILALFGLGAFAPSVRAEPLPSGYIEASRSFIQKTLDERIRLQILLTAAGYWPAVPNVDFNTRIYDAIVRFQIANGFAPDGVLSADEISRLKSQGGPLLNMWGFVQIGLARGSTIWVPFGMGLAQQTTEAGFKYTDHLNRLTLTYDYLAHFTVHRSFDALVADLVNRGFTIEYSKVYRDEFFVVSASDQKTDTYIRYHQFGEGGLGFSLYWNHDSLEIHGERIATLISGSLWSSLTGAPFTTPFTIPDEVQVAVVQPPPTSAPPQQISPPVLPSAPSMVATLPPPESKPKSEGSSGTGFFVTKEGLVLTNAHVVKDCAEIRIAPPQGSFTLATLFARDATNDLALLKTTGSPIRTASLRPTIRLGENVEAFGYPLSTVLATSGNFTLGNVTALAGLRDDSRYLQISAPVQPGNSGGPLLDQNGNLVGVVSAKLNALNVMLATNGDIPQNVNFAIKASVAANFLQTNGVKYENGDATLQLQPADIADQAKSMSVFVECR